MIDRPAADKGHNLGAMIFWISFPENGELAQPVLKP
jgi:hypothetical protein